MKITKKRLQEIIKEELAHDRGEEDFGTDPDDQFGDMSAPAEGSDLVFRGMKYNLPEDPGLRSAAEKEMERLINAFFDAE